MREELTDGLKKVFNKASGLVQEKLEALKKRKSTQGTPEKVPLSGDAVGLSTLREQERGEGVKFYDTENSEVARDAEKVVPKGLDSFGERDTFDPDEADDHQTDRERRQNSDLDQRFYTHGLDIKPQDMNPKENRR